MPPKAIGLSLLLVVGCGGQGTTQDAAPADGAVTADAGGDDGARGGDGPAPPVVLEAASPQMLAGMAGDPLGADCVVRATRGGAPVAGEMVTFTVVAGGGATKPTMAVTAPDGTAATRWTLGFGGKGQTLRASAAGSNVEFTADATSRPLNFDLVKTFPAGNSPWAVAIGKFDSDDLPDLVVTLRGQHGLAVLHNVGGGAFGAAAVFPTGQAPLGLAVARLNGDNIDDVATANSGGNNVTVYFGTAMGALASRNDYAVGRSPFDIVAADFDGSGSRDLAVSNHVDGSVSVLPGDGTGLYGNQIVFQVGSRPRGLALGDLNGDAGGQVGGEFAMPDFVDLVVAQSTEVAQGSTDHTLGVLLGSKALTYANVSSYRVQRGPLDVHLGDVDRDGKVDAVAINETSRSATVALGNGAGAFGPPANFPLSGSAPELGALADVTGDGALDLLVAMPTLGQVHILVNDGTGKLSSTSTVAVGVTPQSVLVGDVNGDGMPDLISANQGSNNVSVLLRK